MATIAKQLEEAVENIRNEDAERVSEIIERFSAHENLHKEQKEKRLRELGC